MKKDQNETLLEVFPVEISQLIKQGKESIECPLEYLVSSVLVVGAESIGASAFVSPKNDWSEYASLYVVMVGNPSMKKTPALKLVKTPLESIQERLHKEFREALSAYNALSKKEKQSVYEPCEQMLYSSDTTIEGLLKHLSNNPLGVSLIVDELSHLFKSLNSYKQGGGDRQYLLQLFSHSQITVTRKGELSIHIKNPVVSILGGIQPEVLKEFFNKGEHDGLTERFIYASPEETISTKFSTAEVEQETIESYSNFIEQIFEVSYNKIRECETDKYKLSPDAKEIWVRWMDGQDANMDNISYLRKSHSMCLRISLILQILNNPERNSLKIDKKSMEGAIRLTNFYIDSFFKTKELMSQSEHMNKSEKVFKWVKENYGKHQLALTPGTRGINIRSIYTYNVAGIKNKLQALEILAMLEEEGKGTIFPNENQSFKGSKKPRIFILNRKYL